MPSDAHLPAAVPGLEIRTVDDETLVHDPAADRVHVLNASAATVLAMCDGRHDVASMAAALRAQYPDASGDLGADVGAVLESFAQLRLIR